MEVKKTKKIRKGDNVLVISGNSRGKIGQVLRVLGEKIYVQGVNVRKKHVRPTRTDKGGILEREMPLHVSNVKVCVNGDQPVKLHVKKINQKQRVLYYNQGSEEVVYRTLNRT